MNETRKLAQFVADTKFEDLPTEVVEKSKVYVLDNLACGFVGSVQPWSKIVTEVAREAGGKKEASMFNQPWHTDISRASLVNGAMIGAFEVEHVGHVSHPSGTVFPAAFATAEREHSDGKSFILALALGYESVCRIGEAQTGATEVERGFHNPAVNGPFGAALAVGKLLGLDALTLANGMGIAGSHACGLIEFAWEGAMTKRFHLGRASQLGLESALMARKGFTGPTTILEGRYGYFHGYSPRPEVGRLLAGLGSEWLMLTLLMKAYACHNTCQAIVQGIQEFRNENPIDPKAITRVDVVTNPRAMEERHLVSEPTNILGGQYSVPFTVAVALSKDMSNPLVYNEETLWDPVIRGLAKRVEVHGNAERFAKFPNDPSAEVVIEVAGARNTICVEDFKGSLRQPLNFDETCEKFRRYTRTMVENKRRYRIEDLVRDLDRLSDMAQLARAIGFAGRGNANRQKEALPRGLLKNLFAERR